MNSFWAPGVARRPAGEAGAVFTGKFGEEEGAEAAAQRVPAGRPRKGARAAARRQAGPARVEGPEPPSGPARSPRLLPRSCRDAAFGLRGARNTPLSPPPPLPGRSAGALRSAARPCRRRVQNVFPAPAFAGALCRALCRRRGAPGQGQGPGSRSPRDPRPARTSPRLRGPDGDSSSARDASLWRRGKGGVSTSWGFSDAWGNGDFCCPRRAEVTLGKGVYPESLCLLVEIHLRLFQQDKRHS